MQEYYKQVHDEALSGMRLDRREVEMLFRLVETGQM